MYSTYISEQILAVASWTTEDVTGADKVCQTTFTKNMLAGNHLKVFQKDLVFHLDLLTLGSRFFHLWIFKVPLANIANRCDLRKLLLRATSSLGIWFKASS